MGTHASSERLAAAPVERAAAQAPAGRQSWMDVDWRAHQRWVTVRGRSVNTVELGSGPPIVFIHGLSGSWQNWLLQLPDLAREHRVIALDLPGFGFSPLPAEPISMPLYASIVDELLQELDAGPTHVVGNSMGGLIAAELAISFPARVRSLVLVSAAGLSTFADPATERLLPAIARMDRQLGVSGAYVAARAARIAGRARTRHASLNVVVRHPRRLAAPLAAEQIAGAGRPGFVPALTAIVEHELRTRLAGVACPTLVVWGDHDRLITARDADRFAELIPGARKVLFHDTGHMSMLEQPEDFNTLLREFLPA